MKLIKFLFWGLGGIALLALVVIAAFALLFDPNAFRDDITRLVEKHTGRELVIEGDLSLTFYPWLGFAAGATTLSNRDGFDDPVMARFDSASASVKLLPLLRKRVEISRVAVSGLDLVLQRKVDGTSNWEDLLGEPEASDADAAAESSGFATEGIGGVELDGSRVVFIDEQAGVRYEARELDLETGALRPGSAFDLDASGYLVSADPALEGPARVEGEVEIDDDGVVRIAQPRMSIEARGESVAGDVAKVTLTGRRLTLDEEVLTLEEPVLKIDGTGPGDPWHELDTTVSGDTLVWTGFDAFDIAAPRVQARLRSEALPDGLQAGVTASRLTGSVDKETATADAVKIDTMGLAMSSGRIEATQIFGDMTLQGRIEVAPFAPRELLAQVGADDIETADATALKTMRLTAVARYAPDAVSLKDIDAKLDDSTLRGALSYTSTGRLVFDLGVDRVNIDRYRAPSETGAAKDAAAGLEEIEIPVAELRELELDGKLRIGEMQLVGIKSTDVSIVLRASGGDVRVNPASAALYGGTYNGDIRLDVRGDTPKLSLNERLSNVQFGPFSADLLDADRLSGVLDGRITATGSGLNAAQITASTNGDATFTFKDGAYEGTDIWYRVRKARALIERKSPPPEPAEERTRFADLSGTASIVDGVMSSDDISMVLPFMKVRGRGSVQLLEQTLDFRLRGDLVDRPDLTADVNELVGITIPFKVTGTVSAPDINVDMGAVLAEVAKRKLGEKLGLSRDTAGQAESPEAVVEQKAEEKKEELKEKIDEKAKDLLKGLLGGGGG